MLRCVLRHQLAHSAADKAKYLLWQQIIIQGTAKNTCFALIANADVHTARQFKLSMLLKLRHRVYESTVCEKAELYTCILSIRNARHNACRAFRTISCKGAIGRAVIGGYIRGILRRIGAQRIAAQSPLYALFFPPLSFSRKKKVVKNEQLNLFFKYLWPRKRDLTYLIQTTVFVCLKS